MPLKGWLGTKLGTMTKHSQLGNEPEALIIMILQE